jgi:hydrogenase maturation protease
MTRIPVLVCGTPLRGDDGAALAAVRELPEVVSRATDLRIVGQLDADLLLEPGIEPCVVVDTVVGVPPGSLVRLSLTEVAEVGVGQLPHSSHSLGVGRAIRLAETVLGRPLSGRFVGIGGVEFHADADLSEPVRDGLPALRDAVADAVAALADPVAAPAASGS